MIDMTGQNLLVVEDEYFIAYELSQSLSKHGAHVVGPFMDLEEASKALRKTAVTGAILDVNLQGQRVYDLADELVARHIPFVFASGYSQSDLPERFHGIPLCEKPYNDEWVIALLARQASEHALRTRN